MLAADSISLNFTNRNIMKFLHTADWHIGQLFHEFDRSYEHQQFLNWLEQTLKTHAIDVLLVSGDIFDISNPAAASIKMFYQFINNATKQNPALQIIITAGNHDSPSRLEAPKPLLESSNVHIIGVVSKDADANIDYQKLIVPIKNHNGTIASYCLAIPFLRMGDYPSIKDCANPYSEGVAELYKQAYSFVAEINTQNAPIIAMGHLHTHNAEITDLDSTERPIMGGVECISASAFDVNIKYVALGHIHKAQRIGGKEHIRYAGSPLPMSFSELNYKHQVIIFDLKSQAENIITVEVPEFVPLLRIPSKHQPVQEVMYLLENLPAADENPTIAPYLEVRVLLDAPEPGLRHKIQTALIGKKVKLAKIDSKYPTRTDAPQNVIKHENLTELQPLDVLKKTYQSKYKSELPDEMLSLFRTAVEQVNQTDE